MLNRRYPDSPGTALPRRRTCILIVTHQCNLNCRYCYESFKSAKAMPFDLAVDVLRSEFGMLARSSVISMRSLLSSWEVSQQ